MPENSSPKWAMIIDLCRCFGCCACVVACSHQNRTPEKFWRKIEDLGDVTILRQRFFLPISCMHCQDPPCEAVCPTGATIHREDGIVEVDADRCIGCGYCILACPYRARTIFYAHVDFEIESSEAHENRNGTCTKCTFCKEKIDEGLARGLRPGLDPDATPACVINCTAQALHFGDLNDPSSNVSQLIRQHHTMRINQGMGTEPSIYYIVPE